MNPYRMFAVCGIAAGCAVLSGSAEVLNLAQTNLDPSAPSSYKNYNYDCLTSDKLATDYSGGYDALTNGQFWADGADPSSDKDYRLYGTINYSSTGAMGAKVRESGTTFEGNSLTIGNPNGWSSSWLSFSGPGSGKTGTLWFKNDGLRLCQNSGFFIVQNASAGTSVITGKVALANTTLQDPARAIIRYRSSAPLQFAFESFTGTSTDVFEFKYMDTYAVSGSPFVFSGNMTDYYGTLLFLQNSVCTFKGVSFPGTLRLDHKVTFDTAQTAVEVGTLFTTNRYVTTSGSILKATISLGVNTTVNSSLRVTDKVTVTGDAGHVEKPNLAVKFSGQILPKTVKTAYTESSRAMTLADMPAAGGKIADQFALDKGAAPSDVYTSAALRGIWSVLMQACFYDEETVGDRQQLNLRIPRFTYSAKTGSQAAPLFTDLSNFQGLTAQDTVQPDTAYVLTSDTTTYPFPNQEDYTFPGAAVIIREGCYPCVLGMVEVTNLIVLGWNNVQTGYAAGRKQYGYRGNMAILKTDSTGGAGGTCNIYGTTDSAIPFDFQANISGDGTVAVISPTWAAENRYVRFAGDNSGFSGTIAAYGREGKTQTFIITRGEALGGALPAFNERAVRIGALGILKVTDDAALTEPTRGLTLQDTARIDVAAGKVFTAGSTTTFTGAVTKSGLGTFKLAGSTAKLGTALPTVAVTAGAFMPAGTDVLENIAVTMAEDTVLEIDGDSQDAGYVEKGIDLAKANISFAGAKKVVVRQQTIVLDKKTAIASGTAEQVAAFMSGLTTIRMSDGMETKRCKITVEDSAAGKTVFATSGNWGMCVIIR